METLDPTITIRNTDNHEWLVRWQQQISDHQYLDVLMKVPRTPSATLPQVQVALIERLQDFLEKTLQQLAEPE